MECPRCSGLEMDEHSAEGGFQLFCCGECAGVWIDTGELTRALLHNNLKGSSSLEGLANLEEPVGTCPDDLTDFIMIESRHSHGLYYALCEACGGLWFETRGDDRPFEGADGDALMAELVGVIRVFSDQRA